MGIVKSSPFLLFDFSCQFLRWWRPDQCRSLLTAQLSATETFNHRRPNTKSVTSADGCGQMCSGRPASKTSLFPGHWVWADSTPDDLGFAATLSSRATHSSRHLRSPVHFPNHSTYTIIFITIHCMSQLTTYTVSPWCLHVCVFPSPFVYQRKKKPPDPMLVYLPSFACWILGIYKQKQNISNILNYLYDQITIPFSWDHPLITEETTNVLYISLLFTECPLNREVPLLKTSALHHKTKDKKERKETQLKPTSAMYIPNKTQHTKYEVSNKTVVCHSQTIGTHLQVQMPEINSNCQTKLYWHDELCANRNTREW